jgi:RNA polymerase sigma-70 factor (ECF subfamily)
VYDRRVNPNPTRSGSGPSDAALVMAARAGEAWASEALFRRHAPMVNGLAYRLLGRDMDVDDLVQDSFVQALGALDALKEPQAFQSWLASIVVRTSSKLLRRRKLLNRLGLRRSGDAIDVDALVGKSVPPDAAAELRALYTVVDALPVKIRVPLLLRRVEGLSLEEIAEYTQASLATVKRRIAEGDAVLAKYASGVGGGGGGSGGSSDAGGIVAGRGGA